MVESQVVSAPALMPPLKIGTVARRSGLTVKTIRSCRDEGLSQPSSREARRSGICTCSDLKARIRSKAGEIGQKIMALQGLQAERLGMVDSWEAWGGRAADMPLPHWSPLSAQQSAEWIPGQGCLKQPTASLARPRGLQRVVVPYHC
ncbi:MAG: hypothetical protein ACK6AD_03350 [Cyanobacteriota bacterium]